MNILPKKSWHVRNKDNIERVRKDEAEAAEKEREAKRRVERAEQEARTEYLRKKAQGALQSAGGGHEDDVGKGESGAVEHLNLFPLEESALKKGNEEYLQEKKDEKEKQERAIGLLVSLGPQPGSEVTPWYMKDGQEKEKEKEEGKEDKKDKKDKEKKKGISEEERKKRDHKLKNLLDPLNDMKKALAVKEKNVHKSKKSDGRDRSVHRSSGLSSIEQLRAERLQREAEEKRRARALLERRSGGAKETERELNDRERPYNSAYFPELARKRQRRDRDSWRDEILKS